jgi:hypothetical protein
VSRRIALFAGNGTLPFQIYHQSKKLNDTLFIMGFEGLSPDSLNDLSNGVHWYPLGHIERIVSFLKAEKITHIMFAGGMKRPSLSSLKLDWLGAKWLKDIGWRAFGDDGLLKGIVHKLEGEGFCILSPTDYIPNNLLEKGSYNKNIGPSSDDHRDIQKGFEILSALSSFDIGQSIVMTEGSVVGIEGLEGTEELIKRCGKIRSGCILIKTLKTHQDQRVDFPSIGPHTLDQLVSADFKGMALQENGCQILEKDKTLKKLQKTHLFMDVI